MSRIRSGMPRRGYGRAVVLVLVGLLLSGTGCDEDDDLRATPNPISTPTNMATRAHTATPTETAVPTVTATSTSTPSAARGTGVANPLVEGPVTGGTGVPFIASTTFDLAQVGYSEEEYFISGTATAYGNAGSAPFAADGKWNVSTGDRAAFRTRMLVYRPISANNFNGTVLMEWLNVSGGLDSAPDWLLGHTELIRAGFAWVGVSAQYVGVEGGSSVLGMPVTPLKTTDPARYGSLVHPGDSFSYDIFSQAAQAIRRPVGANPLGDLEVGAVIAAGESQSAFRLVTYINAVHPVADIFDGFLVHSRGGGALSIAPLSERPQTAVRVPGAAQIRSDLNVPVLTLETETDLTFLAYYSARQPDSERFRLWEVAGTAHADAYMLTVGPTDLGNSPEAAQLVVTSTPLPGFTCGLPINSGPQHFIVNAALAALNEWVRHGTPPPQAPRLEVVPPHIVRDANGNALGGIRTAMVDVPIAALSGEGQSGSIFCLLFGTTRPFDAAKLAELYPDHGGYVAAVNSATDQAVSAGFILLPDAQLIKAAAVASDVGG